MNTLEVNRWGIIDHQASVGSSIAVFFGGSSSYRPVSSLSCHLSFIILSVSLLDLLCTAYHLLSINVLFACPVCKSAVRALFSYIRIVCMHVR